MDTTKWNITNSAQNIVSALVDPSKQYDDAFKREWINTFANFTKHKQSDAKLKPQKQQQPKKLDNEFDKKLDAYISKLENRRTSSSDEATIDNLQENFAQRISKVPEIFRNEDFDLSKVDTFNLVVGIKGPTCDLDKAQLRELQREYTNYLDFIEEMLACQISNKSGDFFQVMSSVHSMMDEISLSIKSVATMRQKFSLINELLITPSMKNISLNRSKSNLQLVLEKLKNLLEAKRSRIVSVARKYFDEQLQEWTPKPPQPSPPFQAISKYMINLHNEIKSQLDQNDLCSLFRKINEAFMISLTSRLKTLEIRNETGPKKFIVLQELAFYKIDIKKLGTMEECDFEISKFWSNTNIHQNHINNNINGDTSSDAVVAASINDAT